MIELLKTITICILRLTHIHKYIFVEGSAFEQSYKSSDGRLLWKVCRPLFIACCQIQSGKMVTHGLSNQSVTHYFEVYERSATDAYLWILCDYIESGMYLEASDQHKTTKCFVAIAAVAGNYAHPELASTENVNLPLCILERLCSLYVKYIDMTK